MISECPMSLDVKYLRLPENYCEITLCCVTLGLYRIRNNMLMCQSGI